MHITRFTTLAFVFSLLTACGGGGGGGGGGGDEKKTNSPGSSVQSVTYVGEENLVALDSTNAMYFMSSAYSALALFRELSLGHFSNMPGYLMYKERGAIEEDVDYIPCESGKYSVKSSGDNKRSVIFDHCSIQGMTLTGKLELDKDPELEELDESSMQVDVLGIEIETEYEKYRVSGFANHVVGGFTTELAIYASSVNEYFALKNVELSDTALSGQFYIGGYGYVNLGYEAPSLSLSGADDTRVDAELDDPIDREVTSALMSLHSDQNTAPFRILVGELFNWPHLEKYFSQIKSEFDVERKETLLLAFSDVVGEVKDFFETNMEWVDGAYRCTPDWLGDSSEVSIASQCVENFNLEVWLGTGVREATLSATVAVMPLAADVEPVPQQHLLEGEELNVQLNILNLEEDGPYDISISSAPEGVFVTPEGLLYGKPAFLLPSDEPVEFSIEVSVDNRKETTVLVNVLSDPEVYQKQELTGETVVLSAGFPWALINGEQQYARLAQINEQYYIDSILNKEIQRSRLDIDLSALGKIYKTWWRDLNGDGVKELIVGLAQGVVILNLNESTIVASHALPISENSRALYLSDFTYVSTPHVVLKDESVDGVFYVLNIQDGSISTIERDATFKALGDLTEKNSVELIFSDGAVLGLDGEQKLTLEPFSISEGVFVTDLYGNGRRQLVRKHIGAAFGGVDLEIKVQDLESNAEPINHILSPIIGDGMLWYPTLAMVDVMGDSALEVVLYDSRMYTRELQVYSFISGSLTKVRTLDMGTIATERLTVLSEGGRPSDFRGLVMEADRREFLFDYENDRYIPLIPEKETFSRNGETKMFRNDDGYSLFSNYDRIKLDEMGNVESIGDYWSTRYDGPSGLYYTNSGQHVWVNEFFIDYTKISDTGARRNEREWYHSIKDVISGENLAIQEGELNGHILVGDYNGNLIPDFFTLYNCVLMYRDLGVANQTVECRDGLDLIFRNEQKLSDLDHDGVQDLVMLGSDMYGGMSLRAYEYRNGGSQLVFEYVDKEFFGATNNMMMSFQNVDADSEKELIVVRPQGSSTWFYVFEGYELVSRFSVPLKVTNIPEFLEASTRNSMVVIAEAESEMRLYELSPSSGRMIWKSDVLEGDASYLNYFNLRIGPDQYKNVLSTEGKFTLYQTN
ncbi:MAG: hypothetical protein VYA55_04795 [Pseudomonadota bacterium]|nr:hypothetical protein [Pseudomonadota bacterium]